MKRIWIYLVFVILVNFSLFSQSPESNDVVLKTNGEEMVGKVKTISDDTISFVYQNETVEYSVKTSELVKITFSSGRIQFFNKFDGSPKPKASLADHHNKVAVLPFGFIKDQMDGSEGMSNKIQQETFKLYSSHNGGLNFQEPKTTNALLIKSGVQNNNIKGFTMGEICNLLGVEYVIQGVVTVSKTNQTNVGSVSTTTKNTAKPYVTSDGQIIGDIYGNGKSKSTSFGVSTSIQNYETSMSINIYNDKGNSIFNQDHTSFWNTLDAYKITLKYLAKRSPLYKK